MALGQKYLFKNGGGGIGTISNTHAEHKYAEVPYAYAEHKIKGTVASNSFWLIQTI
jgi:hypothetical protein